VINSVAKAANDIGWSPHVEILALTSANFDKWTYHVTGLKNVATRK
jgi:hypothetical protein